MEDVRHMIAALQKLRPGFVARRRLKRKYTRVKKGQYKKRPTNIRRPPVPLVKAHAILMLAFGENLKDPSETLLMTIKEISQTSGMSAPYICQLIKKFRDKNGDVSDKRFQPRPSIRPPEVDEFATSKKTLKNTAHMGIHLKC